MVESDTHNSLPDTVPEIRIREDMAVIPNEDPKMLTKTDDDDAKFNGDPEDTTEAWQDNALLKNDTALPTDARTSKLRPAPDEILQRTNDDDVQTVTIADDES